MRNILNVNKLFAFRERMWLPLRHEEINDMDYSQRNGRFLSHVALLTSEVL